MIFPFLYTLIPTDKLTNPLHCDDNSSVVSHQQPNDQSQDRNIPHFLTSRALTLPLEKAITKSIIKIWIKRRALNGYCNTSNTYMHDNIIILYFVNTMHYKCCSIAIQQQHQVPVTLTYTYYIWVLYTYMYSFCTVLYPCVLNSETGNH